MVTFLNNQKVGVRIAVALMLPVLALLYFAGQELQDKRGLANEMDRIGDLAELVPSISAVVHELQKERGTSAIFLSSGGKKFTKELPAQLEETNARLSALEAELARFDQEAYGAAFSQKLHDAEKSLSRLQDMREKVKGQKAKVPEMAGYYTSTIARLLGIVEEMILVSSNAEMTGHIVAYTAFLQGKERAGIERAMGGAGFSAGKFAPATYQKFLQLIAMEDVFFNEFETFATPELKSDFKSIVTGRAVQEVARMRKIAIESVTTGTTGGVEGS